MNTKKYILEYRIFIDYYETKESINKEKEVAGSSQIKWIILTFAKNINSQHKKCLLFFQYLKPMEPSCHINPVQKEE